MAFTGIQPLIANYIYAKTLKNSSITWTIIIGILIPDIDVLFSLIGIFLKAPNISIDLFTNKFTHSLFIIILSLLNIILSIHDMNNIYNKIDTEIYNAFKQNNIDNISRGKNFLAFEAIKRIIKNFIKSELELVSNGNKIIIKFLEHSFSKSIKFSNKFSKNLTSLNLKGNIDRVDIFNGDYRIIDYKTGFVSNSELKSENLMDLNLKPKLLQLLMYSWLLQNHNNSQNFSVTAGIINLRATAFQLQNAEVNNSLMINTSVLKIFENEVIKMVSKMFDPNETFEHLNKEQSCYFCD